MSDVATHAWLRRVSDYCSGGVSTTERAAVEAHLATCSQCREALATYQRFDALALTDRERAQLETAIQHRRAPPRGWHGGGTSRWRWWCSWRWRGWASSSIAPRAGRPTSATPLG